MQRNHISDNDEPMNPSYLSPPNSIGAIHILYNALREARGFRNLLYALYEGGGVFVLMLHNALKSVCII